MNGLHVTNKLNKNTQDEIEELIGTGVPPGSNFESFPIPPEHKQIQDVKQDFSTSWWQRILLRLRG